MMSQPELKFQKEMVISGRKHVILSEITTDRFKKGRPDLYFKPKEMEAFHIECKYEVKRKTLSTVPIETTELQKLCLQTLRDYNALVFISVCVEIDKKTKVVYNVYDIKQTVLDLNTHYFEPLYREKGKIIWPVEKMLKIAEPSCRVLA